MANPVSIVQAILDVALKIKKEVETFRHNREDCRKIGELVATVRAVAEGLRKTTEKEDGGALVGGALSALKQALERAWDLVVAYQRKKAVLRALDADAMAVKLRRVYLDVSLNQESRLADWWPRSRLAVPETMRRGFDSMVLLLSWVTWKERNRPTFDGIFNSVNQVFGKVKEEGSDWIGAGFGCLAPLFAS